MEGFVVEVTARQDTGSGAARRMRKAGFLPSVVYHAGEGSTSVLISTRDKNDVKKLREKIIAHFEEDMVDLDILIPFNVQGAIGEVRKSLKVLQESYSETGSLLKVRGNEEKILQIKKKFNL